MKWMTIWVCDAIADAQKLKMFGIDCDVKKKDGIVANGKLMTSNKKMHIALHTEINISEIKQDFQIMY